MLPIAHQVLERRRRRVQNLQLLRQRLFIRNAQNPFEMGERQFIELFRLNKVQTQRIIEEITPHFPPRFNRRGLSTESAVLCALRFYATGSYQRCLGEEYNCSIAQSTVHKYVHLVTNLLVENFVALHIAFPDTLQERREIQREFRNRWGFPGCIGAVDGTHIPILKPRIEEHNFINRKGYHSINGQIICDHTLKIRSVNTNYGGSTHDSFIWRNSNVQQYLRGLHANEERCWLIGDSGYPQQRWLMTPFRNPENPPQERYNSAHILARNCVERCIGNLKMRFRCLHKERTARYEPQIVAKFIKVCCALHNICIEANIPFDMAPENNGAEEAPQVPEAQVHNEGLLLRAEIVNLYFT